MQGTLKQTDVEKGSQFCRGYFQRQNVLAFGWVGKWSLSVFNIHLGTSTELHINLSPSIIGQSLFKRRDMFIFTPTQDTQQIECSFRRNGNNIFCGSCCILKWGPMVKNEGPSQPASVPTQTGIDWNNDRCLIEENALKMPQINFNSKRVEWSHSRHSLNQKEVKIVNLF